MNQIGGALAYRAPTFAVGASAYHRTRWTALDVRGTLGWNPVPLLTASAEAVHQHHYGGRVSDFVSLSAGLQPIRGIALTGSARLGKMFAAPAITADTAQDISIGGNEFVRMWVRTTRGAGAPSARAAIT